MPLRVLILRLTKVKLGIPEVFFPCGGSPPGERAPWGVLHPKKISTTRR